MSFIRKSALLPVIFLISSCAYSDDPSEGGFIAGIGNLATGTYDKRLQEKNEELASEQGEKQRLLEENRGLEGEREEASRALADYEKEAKNLEVDLAALREELQSAKESKRVDETELARFESELDAISVQRTLVTQDPALDAEERRNYLDALSERKKILEQTLADALATD